MKSHAAKFSESNRLQKLHKLLSNGGIYTTARIHSETGIEAVHSAIHELRCNGYDISSHYLGKNGNGNKVFGYQLESAVCQNQQQQLSVNNQPSNVPHDALAA